MRKRLLPVLALVLAASSAAAEPRTLRVGVWDNPPIVSPGRDGTPSGIAIDFLGDVAAKEGWKLDYVAAPWAELQGMLERGDIDLMAAIARNDERARRFDFTHETLVGNWGIVYQRAGAGIDSLFDLKGLRVAVLEGSSNSAALMRILDGFDIGVVPVAAKDYYQLFSYVAEGRADVGVTNRLFGLVNGVRHGLQPTPIVFNPLEVRPAVPKNRHGDILAVLDAHLALQKRDPQSAYQRSIERWLSAPVIWRLPPWLAWSLAGGGVVTAVAFAGAWYYRRQFLARTRDILRANRELRQSEQNFRHLIDGSIQGVLVASEDRKPIFANQAYAAMFGFESVAEVLALDSTLDLAAPHERARLQAMRGARLRGESAPERYEYDGLRTDGAVIRVQALSRVLNWGDRRVVQNTLFDVTELRRHEQELKDKSTLLEAILENMDQGVLVVDSGWRIVAFNRRFVELNKLPGGKFRPGDRFEDYLRFVVARGDFGPGDPDDILRRRLETVRSHDVYQFERTLPDGTVLEIRGTPMPGGGFVRTFTDVTARHQAEQEILSKSTLLEAILESMDQGVLVVDADFRISAFNRRFDELIKLPPDRFRPGDRFEDYVRFLVARGDYGSGDPDAILRARLEVARRRDAYHFERALADGTVLEVRSSPMPDGGFVRTLTDVTARRKVEQALRESESRLRQLLETTRVIPWEADPATFRFTYVGPYAVQVLGYPIERWTEPGFWLDHTHPDDRGWTKDFCLQATQRGEDHEFEYRMIAADGRIVWLRDIVSVIGRDGTTVALRGFMIDITERKRTEEALRQSEEHFRNLIEGSLQGTFVQIGQKPVFVNQKLADILGYASTEELMTCGSVLDWIAPHERERLSRYRDARLTGGTAPEVYEYQGLRKDGTFVWLENRVRVIQWYGETALQTTVVDIDERKKAGEALRQSEEHFRNLIEASLQGVSVNIDNKPVFANQRLADILGYASADELMACESVLDWAAPHEHARLLEYRKARFEGRQAPEIYEYQGRRKNGSLIWLENRVRVIKWHGQTAIQISVIDVDERKKAEEKLVQAKDQAEMANRAKSEFLANMSHELRTPLNSVIGFADMLRTETLGPVGNRRYIEYAADIKASGTHLLEVINDILDLSKIESGEFAIEETIVDVRDAVETCVRMIRPRAIKARLEFETKLPATPIRMRGDSLRLKQILLNLLSNSVKFTPAGGTVTVRGAVENGAIVLSVSDTGIGIAPEDIPRVLEPFAQVEGSLTRGHEGTGLGLTLVKRLTEKHGGALTIASAPGRGTTVTIRFPPERTAVSRQSTGSDASFA